LALEIAAGSRINSIVVDSDSTASKCIQELKNSRLGTATFLPLNKIKPKSTPPSISSLLKKNGVEGLALNLINYDKKFSKIFSYVFGSTLIVDSIETARRIGIGKIRMVTLEGDLMDISGAMVGGYRQKNRIVGFKEKELGSNLKTLEKDISQLKASIRSFEKEKIVNEDNLSTLKNEKNSLEGEVIKLEKSLSPDIDISKLTSEQNDLNSQLSNLSKEISNLDDELNSKNKKISELRENKNKAKEKAQNQEIINKVSELEDKKLSLNEKISKTESEISSINTQIETILKPELNRTGKILKEQEKEAQEKKSYGKFKNLASKRTKLNEKIQTKESILIRNEEKIKNIEQRMNNLSIERAKFVAEKESLEKEYEEFKDAPIKKSLSLQDLNSKIKECEQLLNKMGNVNLRALEVYDEIAKEHKELLEKVNKLKEEKQDVLNMMEEIESNKKETFMKTYNIINKNFKQIFSSLSDKGQAHFELENPENPFEAGLDIKVKIAGNKFLDIKSLSGGEKTMTALAFIFAIQEYQPSSFYFLDEVDAALDKRNSETLSKLVAKYSEKAQYIVISHNDTIISEADQIYGVSMQDGISKVISLKV